MKKRILGLAILASGTLLVGCTDPEQNSNDVVLQNVSQKATFGGASYVGINQTDISGFTNNSEPAPTTEVTLTFSGDAATSRTDGCLLIPASGLPIATGLTSTSASNSVDEVFDSTLGGLLCANATAVGGPYTADVRISFTAGGKSYSATTTLTAAGGT